MENHVQSSGDCLRVVGDMTIYTAVAVFDELRLALARVPAPASIDLSGVTEMDTAGVQILLMAQQFAKAAGSGLRFADPSPSVSDVLELLRIPASARGLDEVRR